MKVFQPTGSGGTPISPNTYWQVNGNTGLTPGSTIGTTDNVNFSVLVNGIVHSTFYTDIATGHENAIAIGYGSLASTSSVSYTNAIGYQAGNSANTSNYSNFIGGNSGNGATNAYSSDFIGYGSGINSTNANNSIFIGYYAGSNAVNANNMIAIGQSAGLADTINNSLGGFSILIGSLSNTGGFSDSIAFGSFATNTKTHQLMIGDNTGFGGEISEIAWQGYLRSSNMHNNPASQGTVNEQDVRSGTYEPTLTPLINVQPGISGSNAMWHRVGNIVKVSGTLEYTPQTPSAPISILISLPVTSNITQTYQAVGYGVFKNNTGATNPAYIEGDISTSSAVFSLFDQGGGTYNYEFTYEVF